MEKFVSQLTIDGILDQANQVFGDLLSGTMDMVGKLTETIGSVTAGL
ncbi:MAG: hypothetical protein ACQ9CV_06475 [Nitrosopumilus sp.]